MQYLRKNQINIEISKNSKIKLDWNQNQNKMNVIFMKNY